MQTSNNFLLILLLICVSNTSSSSVRGDERRVLQASWQDGLKKHVEMTQNVLAGAKKQTQDITDTLDDLNVTELQKQHEDLVNKLGDMVNDVDDVDDCDDEDYEELVTINNYLEDICLVWGLFDNVVRSNHDVVDKWAFRDECEIFDPMDDHFCPPEDLVQSIFCNPLRNSHCVHSNPTVRVHYCAPMFAPMFNASLRSACVDHCVNYVSQERGDCCRWTCDNPSP